jgi:Ni/Co efflux regulator RcnB
LVHPLEPDMMTLLKQSHRILALLIAAFFAAGPAALADRGDKADKHAEKQAQKAHQRAEKAAKRAEKHERGDVRFGAYFDDRHRKVARTYYTQHYGGAGPCPPGLAKKRNGCMPPGQAKKLAVGQPLPAGVAIYAVPQPVLVQLPPPPYGYRYARVGDDIVLVRAHNNLVVDIIVNVFG